MMASSTKHGRTKRPILVTGSAGFVGSRLAAHLASASFDVVAFDNLAVGSLELLTEARAEAARFGTTLTFETGDLRDATVVRDVVEKHRPWAVVHLAALHFIPYCSAHPAETLSVNVVGTQNLLDALRLEPPERCLFASSAAVYAPQDEAHRETSGLGPTDVYGLSKYAGELLVTQFSEQSLIPCTSMRFFNIYGPGETNPHIIPEIVRQLERGDELELGSTSSYRDLIHVNDVVCAIETLLRTEPPVEGPVNVGTGEEHSVDELIALLSHHLGRSITVATAADRLRRSDRPHLRADNTRMRKLGWLPRVKLEEGLTALVRTDRLVGSPGGGQ
jgi:UDP-glucose 4-epimerase